MLKIGDWVRVKRKRYRANRGRIGEVECFAESIARVRFQDGGVWYFDTGELERVEIREVSRGSTEIQSVFL